MPVKASKRAVVVSMDAMLAAIQDEVLFGLGSGDEQLCDAYYALQSICRIAGLVRAKLRSVARFSGSKNDAYLPIRRPGGQAVG